MIRKNGENIFIFSFLQYMSVKKKIMFPNQHFIKLMTDSNVQKTSICFFFLRRTPVDENRDETFRGKQAYN